MHWRRKWQPTPVFLPGESQRQGAWWAAVYGVAQSWTRLKRLSSSSSSRLSPKSSQVKALVTQSCPTICNHMDWGPPGSSVHGILQARMMVVSCHFLLQGIFLTQGSNLVSCTAGRFLTIWATREAPQIIKLRLNFSFGSPRNGILNQSWIHVQSYLTLWTHGSPGSSVHGIVQVRTLECTAISSSKGSFICRDPKHVSWVGCTGRKILCHCSHLGKPLKSITNCLISTS